MKLRDGDEQIGVIIVKRAIEEPPCALAENAGEEGAIVVQEVKRRKGNEGYNVATNEYEDLVKAGVVDPDDLRQIRALIGVHNLFQMLEGPHSSKVHETIWQLLLPKLRPGLRRWYQRAGADKDPAAVALRDHLSQLAGEKLENVTDIPHNTS